MHEVDDFKRKRRTRCGQCLFLICDSFKILIFNYVDEIIIFGIFFITFANGK